MKAFRRRALRLLASNGRVSWSQFGEDLLMKAFLPEAVGTYVEIGAGHPTHLSNSFFFYQEGWRGLLVEPNPALIELLHKHRDRDAVLGALIGTSKASRSYYQFESWPLSTTDVKRVLELRDQGVAPISLTSLPVRSLASLELAASPLEPAFLSIDVEGADLDVLTSNDWTAYRPRVICVEERDAATSDTTGVASLLSAQGYQFVSRAIVSSIYVHEDYLRVGSIPG